MEKYETVIVGAGPGGLNCAKTLARAGKEVLVLERQPKPFRKICTGIWGLTKKTNDMELPEHVFEAKFSATTFRRSGREALLKPEEPFVATLDRRKLSEWQVKTAKKAGAEVRFGEKVSRIGNDFVEINGQKVKFRHLIGADGSASIVRKSLGLPFKVGMGIQYTIKGVFESPEVHFDPKHFGPWYAWIAPHRKFAFVGAGGDPSRIPAKRLKENLDMWCIERGIEIHGSEFEGAPIQYCYKGWRFGNKFLVGDAAGFASGWTGEGIYFAMASGEDVANAIINPKHNPLLIKKILSLKRQHELVLRILSSNRYATILGFAAGSKLLKYKPFQNWLIELVC